MKILVTHPGRQHSHQAALALAARDHLAGYWAGVPCLPQHRRRVPSRLWRRHVRYAPVELPPERVRWFPWTPALRRLGDRWLPASAAAWVDHFSCRLFSRWVARGLGRLEVDAVIACETAALTAFAAARRRGIVTLLDAPSIHHAAQDRLHRYSEPRSLHRRITALKDREIELADHILTVSALARETYLVPGVDPERVHSVMLGADTGLFSPGEAATPARPEMTFLFCGATIYRKGFDLLIEAFDRMRREEPDCALRLVGPLGDAAQHLETVSSDGITVVGSLRQAELVDEFRRADCLVLPSRNDSFGMVVAEALATGLPALVSEMVGAKELVSEGETGWIVPVEDAGALARRMLWCARNRAAVRALRPRCREVAAGATWSAYRKSFSDLLEGLVERR